MTTAELIARLRAADPSGELPVSFDGEDVYTVTKEEGYYDGRYEQLIHDPEKRDRSYSIIGARISTRGYKVRIRTLGIATALADNPDLPVEIDVSEHSRAGIERQVERWRLGPDLP